MNNFEQILTNTDKYQQIQQFITHSLTHRWSSHWATQHSRMSSSIWPRVRWGAFCSGTRCTAALTMCWGSPSSSWGATACVFICVFCIQIQIHICSHICFVFIFVIFVCHICILLLRIHFVIPVRSWECEPNTTEREIEWVKKAK